MQLQTLKKLLCTLRLVVMLFYGYFLWLSYVA